MPNVTIRNLPDETHRALKAQAVLNGRSTEAEIRMILSRAVKPEKRLLLGEALAAFGREYGLTDADVEIIDNLRDKTPHQPVSFE